MTVRSAAIPFGATRALLTSAAAQLRGAARASAEFWTHDAAQPSACSMEPGSARHVLKLLEQGENGVLLIDRHGRCKAANGSALRLLRIDAEHLRGMNLLQCVPAPEGGSAPASVIEEALSEQEYRTCLGHFSDRDQWLRLHVYPGENESLVLVSDRTGWERQLHALADMQAQFRTLVEELQDPVLVVQDESIVYVNPAFVQTYGADPVAGGDNHRDRFFHPDEHDRVRGFQASLERGVHGGRAELKTVTTHGDILLMDARASRFTYDGLPAVLVVLRDITERKRLEARLQHQALHDPLTGLANRALLMQTLNGALKGANRMSDQVGLLLIDLNGFKQVNDTYGHATGDAVLREVAQRFTAAVRQIDLVARLGGDEFAVVLAGVQDSEAATATAWRLLAGLKEPMLIDGAAIPVGASIGVAMAPADGHDADELLRLADAAMYRAKLHRSGVVHQHSEDEGEAVATSPTVLAHELSAALANHEFRLEYQPIVDPYTRRVHCVEALLRWPHPSRGLIPPALFIPIAERSGIVSQITEWVLREALRQVARWCEDGLDMTVSVNVAVQDLESGDLPEIVAGMLSECRVAPRHLHIEVTEQGLVSDFLSVAATTRALQAMGVTVAIDDFGVGQAALGYLRHFLASEIKIDKSLVAGMLEREEDAALVRSIIEMAAALNKTVVAEGVEDRATLDLLMTAGCDAIQGFYYSPAVAPGELAGLVARIEETGVGLAR